MTRLRLGVVRAASPRQEAPRPLLDPDDRGGVLDWDIDRLTETMRLVTGEDES
jgi:hypothetical protein